MRNLLVLLFLCPYLTLSGATYYVAPNGSDSNTGTQASPFFTLNKAWTVVAAGDIIYMRGGTYHYGTTMNSLSGKSGTSGNTIKIWAYPGEYPVIDYTGVALTGQKIALRLNSISYVHFKGFRIANMTQENTSNAWPHYGIILYNDVSNCIFEQLEVDHIGGTGFTIADRCNNNLFLNCDSHHHADPYSSDPYGMSDGFESGSHGANTSTNNTFKNCRAWSNSDDGWDLRQADGVYTVDGCWSFRNGFIPGTSTAGGNGDGFKLGGKTSPGTSTILRTLKNSIAFENRATGITPEPDAAGDVFGLDVINCTSYKNARNLGEGINTGNYNNYTRLRNCISYGNYRTNAWMQGGAVHDHNSWDIPKTVSDADFQSINSSGTDGPRQSDGSLPVTSFLQLAAGSGLIDVGVDVGQIYSGAAPDLGAFERVTGTPANPVYTSSCIANATPSLLEMTYNLALANIVPASSSFSVLVNSTSRTVNSVAISGTKVQLTLASPVIFGDVVTVAYTKPPSNPVQTAAGGQAITIGAQSVTNNVSAVAPVYVGSAIQNATPSLLEMTYNLSLANIVPASSSFTVLVNSTSRTVNSVAISGTKVQLTLASLVIFGDVVTVAYTKPSSNPVQTAAGGQAITIGAQSVTNNVSAVAPVYVSSAIQNATPSLLEMTYNLTLANIVPASSSFTVLVNSTSRTVNSVAISGTKMQLTLASPVIFGDVVTVAYTKPSSNQIQTAAGGQAITIGAQSVTNNVSAVAPVYVSSAIQNATPSLLEMTYNLSLANIVPSAYSFSVLVNSTSRTVNSVAISGTKVQLTLASPVIYGDLITVAYTKPSSNPIQTSAGGQAITIGAHTVTNNVNSTSTGNLYVSPNGSDSNPGTITQPFFTLNKAWSVVTAGNTIYMRGGSYHYGTIMSVLSDKSGTPSNTIKIWAYPGEYPIIDYAGVSLTGQKIGLRLHNINYVHIKGIRICNMTQENVSNAWTHYGIILYDDVSNCIFEQLEVDHIGGTGFTIADRCNNNLFLNCDSHHHQDPHTSRPYGASDGFESGSHGSNTSTNNTFRNCRAWSNSSNGWNLRQADGVYVIDNCWSFRNGFIPGTTTSAGSGAGYKLGGKTTPGTNSILRTIKNSLAFENRGTGITPEPDGVDNIFGLDIINCISYKNARDLGEGINTGNYNNYTRVRNCISYANLHSNVWMQSGAVHDHNNWDIPKSVTDGDFVSVNSTGVDAARQTDGSLPVTSFLHLAVGSGLIDAGVDAGLAYIGKAPDLGAFEVQTSKVVKILNPITGTSYENLSSVPIEALVSDSADVTKVEFFNGADKLVELTSAPYTYIWKEVPAGNYSITAIATDNSNNTLASAPVEFAVGSPIKNNISTTSDLISLFPNPNNGQFSIEFSNPLQNERSEIVITDLNGKQVYNDFVSREEIVKQFDVSSLNKGIYVLMVRDKQILVTKKFIKK